MLPLRGVPDFSNMRRTLLCVPTDCEDAKLTKKNTNTSKNAQVLRGQDAIIIVDNAGVLRQRRAFEVPTIPLEHFAEAKHDIANLENAKDYSETSFNVAFHQELFKKGIMMNFLAKLSQDSNVARQNTLVHSTPQACLGVNRHDSMLPTSPKSMMSLLMRFRLIQAIFTSTNFIRHPGCYQACLFHSSPAIAKCHNDMPRSIFAKLTVANAGNRVS